MSGAPSLAAGRKGEGLQHSGGWGQAWRPSLPPELTALTSLWLGGQGGSQGSLHSFVLRSRYHEKVGLPGDTPSPG